MASPHELPTTVPASAPAPVTFLELDITGRLECDPYQAESGPTILRGTMNTDDWERLIISAPAAGITAVQIIGGEPTMHPDFEHLIGRALDQGLRVQVHSNLYQVRESLWGLLSEPAVSLSTSYYSDDPEQHEKITGRRGSHGRTLANIREAIQRGIPLQVGIVDTGNGQRAQEAHDQMTAIGVPLVRMDRMHGVGRATHATATIVGELCGRCGHAKAAVSLNGDVWMCARSRFLQPAGNVKDSSLAAIFAGTVWWQLLVMVHRSSASTECRPDPDGNDCRPAEMISPPLPLGRLSSGP
ncbi:radical SAM protein [Planotetraspora kaengkrachanensis]|uniref:Radical SAM core domain-containing protein n=1 Tax=Planotetraspora kaengkrachanensis TaxID=575193 RepID=A0A8J3PYG3_9ACTN|nr:radical SAM protein [Planotetraspora kaengkrachanensis]GIG83300.1 hypothetical protein Pka01_64270 [Planotetraspora kaengkrachanensis]